MPVLITGATGRVGRALARRLAAEGGQVRAYVRRDDPELRALGVHLATGAADDVERLESALTRVHTIVHLVGGAWPGAGVSYDLLNRDSTEAAAIAARAADVRRILFLSALGADPESPNEYLAAKGRAEEHVRAAEIEHAIFRCTPVWEGLGGTLRRLARRPLIALPGGGRARLNPVALADVVDALVAADAREAEVAGTWDLGGPDVMTLAEAAERLGVSGRRARLPGIAPRALNDLFARDQVADGTAAAAQFGLRLTAVA